MIFTGELKLSGHPAETGQAGESRGPPASQGKRLASGVERFAGIIQNESAVGD